MTEREAVHYIAQKTHETSLAIPGKVVFGLWHRGTGEVCFTDDVHEAERRVARGHKVIRTCVDGIEVEQIGRQFVECRDSIQENNELLGDYDGAMVHMNRELLWKIRSM